MTFGKESKELHDASTHMTNSKESPKKWKPEDLNITELIPKGKVLELVDELEEKGFHRKDKKLFSYWFTYNEMFRFKKQIKEI